MVSLVLKDGSVSPAEVTCSVRPCRELLGEDLQAMLSAGKLEAFGTWSVHPKRIMNSL